jgi:hypothetical protein
MTKKIFILILFIMFFLPITSFAADIFFDADKNNFTQNENFLIQIFLDTKNSTINAVEGTIVFLPDFLELKEIRDGNSSINFWIEEPSSREDGKVSFSGITAGGFSGQKMFLFGLVFNSKKIGNSSIAFDSIKVLQNDGLGTKIPIEKSKPFTFSVSKKPNDSVVKDLKVEDTDPPEDFKPFVANDPSVYGGKFFLVFSTVDKGSGIDHYEVRESFWGLNNKYIIAKSPYLLKDQTLKSKIYIKAIDKAQNEKEIKLKAQNPLALLEQILILAIILTICIFLFKKIKLKLTP